MNVDVEFFVEPFSEGSLGVHVTRAVETIEGDGFDVLVGPFGNQASGLIEELAPAISRMLVEAFTSGASRVSITVVKSDQ